ncbi:MAG: porin [Myxococcota bacterium]
MFWTVLMAMSGDAHAFEIVNKEQVGGFDRVRVTLGGFMQPRFTLVPDDTEQGIPGELGFALARSRLEFGGYLIGPLSIKPRVTIELIPEARLVDSYLNLSVFDEAQIRFGQFKAPTNRSFLVSDKNTLFPERAELTDVIPRREMGVMLHGDFGERIFEYQLGAFNGEGTNRLSNVNRQFLYAGRIVVSPLGSPGTTTELLPVKAPTTISLGVSAHINVIGDEGEQEGSSGINAESLFHWKWITLQAEYLFRSIDWENVDVADFDQEGWYVQTGIYVPGNAWLQEHIVIIGRAEEIEAYEPIDVNVPLVSANDPNQRRREYAFGLTYLAGAELLNDPQDLRIQVTYAIREELEDIPYTNNAFTVAAHVTY